MGRKVIFKPSFIVAGPALALPDGVGVPSSAQAAAPSRSAVMVTNAAVARMRLLPALIIIPFGSGSICG